jgi:hypothetical protein
LQTGKIRQNPAMRSLALARAVFIGHYSPGWAVLYPAPGMCYGNQTGRASGGAVPVIAVRRRSL